MNKVDQDGRRWTRHTRQYQLGQQGFDKSLNFRTIVLVLRNRLERTHSLGNTKGNP
mgnify:CR=1 FL=1